MDTSLNITAATFAAYLKCATKSHLMAHGEQPPDTFISETCGRISEAYKLRANQNLRMRLTDVAPIDFVQLTEKPAPNATTVFVDCETAFYSCDQRAAPWSVLRRNFVPTLYSAWNKSDQSDDLLVCFCALAIGRVTGSIIPSIGKVVYSDSYRIKTVRIADQLARTQQVIEAITSLYQAVEAPKLVLNEHCSKCDFQSRCRVLALDRDDLSLLGAMTAKERAKCEEKGISTITQLSYGYRPRRKRRKPTTLSSGPLVKHDHKLKALAIKKGRTHVVGSPSLSIEGTPVFMDVEGIPDRDFYYLIGLKYEARGVPIEQSFWANSSENECDIWCKCIRTLKGIDSPRIVHYGAYESRFLKQMRYRWGSPHEDAEFIDRIVEGSLNLLAVMYARIYFPTYSNGLKETARWLGFAWTWQQASGSAAMIMRRCWELTSDDELRRKLIAYNIEDCRAAAVMAEAIACVCGNATASGTMKFEPVDVASLEVSFQRTFGKFASALPEFEKINTAAYWDYQRSRVYIRTNKTIQRSVKNAVRPPRIAAVEKEVVIDDRPQVCPKCGSSRVWIAARMCHVVFDLKFTRRGLKRWAVRYRYNSYRCGACKGQMTIHSGRDTKYGQNLRSYIVYLLIELRLSNEKIREHLATVFNIAITGTMANDVKVMMARKYEHTYRQILEGIAVGSLVHADETKGVVYGGGHYVWIFANLTSVAYVYSASREASILEEILAGFNGVLVSDFYGGYDAVPCQQQKCLIHLMRDINADVLKHPFNEELAFVARRFGALVREIVETIDRYGLKKRHLRKHKPSADKFLYDVTDRQCTTEAGSALKKRIEKNRNKLFTFLDHDNVPWNNNNAEHAVRAFTRLRNVMITSTPKGTREYCVLLTLQQTLRYRGLGFLDFLRSGKIDVDH